MLECVFAEVLKAIQCGGPVSVISSVRCSSADCIYNIEINVAQQFACRGNGITTHLDFPIAVCREHAITAHCGSCRSPILYAQEVTNG